MQATCFDENQVKFQSSLSLCNQETYHLVPNHNFPDLAWPCCNNAKLNVGQNIYITDIFNLKNFEHLTKKRNSYGNIKQNNWIMLKTNVEQSTKGFEILCKSKRSLDKNSMLACLPTYSTTVDSSNVDYWTM